MLNGKGLPHELLLTTIQKTKLRKAFNHNMSTDLKLPRAQISKVIQSGGFLGLLLSKESSNSFSKKRFSSVRNTATASAIDPGIQKKIHGSGTTTLIISNEEMNDMMKIVQALEDPNILLRGATKHLKAK